MASANDPEQVVTAYLRAIEAHEPERVRALLAESGFRYTSPIATFDDADHFLSYIMFTSGILQRIQVRRTFVDQGDVCQFLVFHVQLSDKMAVDLVQWAHVRDGRIHSLELLFDAHPYRRMFGS